MLYVVAGVTAFIIYGSLYPFDFSKRPETAGAVGYLIGTWRDWDRSGDLLSNILLYMPLGFFATQALPVRWPRGVRALAAMVAGTVLSCCMELGQFHDVGRVTSMGDVYANAIGSAVGAISAAVLGAGLRWPLIRALAAEPDASLILVMFVGYRLYPYVPTMELQKYWHAVREMVLQPSVPGDGLARYVIMWLLIGMLVHRLFGGRLWFVMFPLFVLGEFAGKIMVVDATLVPSDVAGAGIALVLWAGWLRWVRWRGVVVAVALAGLIVALRLQPFLFGANPLQRFGWVPFWSMMHGSIGVAMQAFCEKSYLYGGLIWLLDGIGLGLPVATGVTAALLFVTSYAEIYLPGRSGEITDAAMAIGIGWCFLFLRNTRFPSIGAPRVVAAAARP